MTFLLGNLRLKFLALGLAAIFWGLVSYTANPTRVQTFRLAIEHPTTPAGLVLLSDLPQIPVTVAAPTELLRNFDQSTLHVTADLATVRPGRNRVRIHVDSSDPSISLLSSPDAITVDVDEIGSLTQVVSIERLHSLPDGFHEVSAATTPSRVTIDGPKSQLAGAETWVTVDLAGQEAPFQQTATVIILDSSKKPLSHMTAVPPQVVVEVAVQANNVTETRTVGFTLSGQPASGFRVTGADVTPLTVAVTGLPAILAGLAQVLADPIDITGASSDVTRIVTLRPPAGVDVSPKTVQVHVLIGPLPKSA